MKIKKSDSLVVAENVTNLLTTVFAKKLADNHVSGTIEAYQNGREQGHTITCLCLEEKTEYSDLTVLFDITYHICEHRNTDSICIYKGSAVNGGLSADAYANANTFNDGDYYQAALWLCGDIIQSLRLKQYTDGIEKILELNSVIA